MKVDMNQYKWILAAASAAALVALAGCKSAQPYAGADGAGGQVDYTAMESLPQRGNFNPDQDVDYGTLKSADNDCGIIYFATDASTIGAGERPKLEKISAWMNKNPERQILIAGHCDDRGSLGYNRALGERRAIAVRDYLMGLGIAPNRVYTHSYGEERPAVQGSGDSAWAKNRRGEVGIVVGRH